MKSAVKTWWQRDPLHIAIGIFALITLLRILWVLIVPLPPHPDEAQYADWAQTLDWAYYSKPPLIAVINRIAMEIGGIRVESIRLAAVLISTVTMWALASAFRSLFTTLDPAEDRRRFAVALMIAATVPYICFGGLIATTDVPMLAGLALWLWAVAPAWRPCGTLPRWRWLIAGLCLAIACQGKYAALLVLPGWVVATLWFRPVWWRSLWPNLMLVLGIVLGFAPVAIWNAQHNWVGYRHVATLATGGKDRDVLDSVLKVGEFIAAQIGLLGPAIAIALIVAVFVRRYRSQLDRRVALLLLLGLPALLALIIKGFFTQKLYANWGGPALVPLIVLGLAVIIGHSVLKRFLPHVALILGLGLMTLLIPVSLVLDTVHLPKNLEPRRALLLWDQLGAVVDQKLQNEPHRLMVGNYQLAAELAFHIPRRPRPLCANFGRRRMNQYDVWNDFPAMTGQPVLWVGGGKIEQQPEVLLNQAERRETITLRRGQTEQTWTLLWIPALIPEPGWSHIESY
jgi:4-amino-4-deoxy-L-arabinose transferase-like glycosyltransferase